MNNQDLLKRFIQYVEIDTQSNPDSTSIPSSEKQKDLANLLESELNELGLEIFKDDHGYLVAKLKSNLDYEVDAIGFLAHLDTSSEYSGKDVKVKIFENYDGSNLVLNDQISIDTNIFSEILAFKNQTILTASGDTLLGGDDKAGVAIIMEMLKYFINNPKQKHGDVYVAFTYDEEIGVGIDNFDLSDFKVKFAYTVDGGLLGELNYETFNAASLKVNIKGVSVHPGSAKAKMVNALEVANDFHNALPKYEKPQYTQDYEGFYMLMSMQGDVSNAALEYIIRDHDLTLFEKKKTYVKQIVEQLQNLYPQALIEYELKDQYYNMAKKINELPIALELAKKSLCKE